MSEMHKDDIEKKLYGKFRISSARLKNYDYSQNGAYFITICSKNREHFFGNIENNEMQLSEIGKIACNCWKQIPNHFPFVNLGEWIVMPNHIHGIFFFDKSKNTVETQDFASLQKPYNNKFGPQSKNLASVIRGFKIGVTKYARKNTNIFDVWQPRFHDHIIRNENEIENISEYIISNPFSWENDDYF